MSSHRELLILGDSNVKRFYSRIGLTQAQTLDFVQARNMTELSTALTAFKSTYKIVVLAFLTNLVIDSGDSAVNDVDRMSNIEETFNTVIPMIRCVTAEFHSFYFILVLVLSRQCTRKKGHPVLLLLKVCRI